MGLPSDLISQFVKITNDSKQKPKETTVYGTVKIVGEKTFVQLDGSSILTPVATTSTIRDGNRVTVLIKNHAAIVTGNVSSPSASSDALKDLSEDLGLIGGELEGVTNDFDLLIKTVTLINDELEETVTRVDGVSNNLNSVGGRVGKLEKHHVFKTTFNTDQPNIWSYLGRLWSTTQGDACIITLYGGSGQNGDPYQNTTMQIFIKKGFQSTPSTTEYYGVSYWYINGAPNNQAAQIPTVKVLCSEVGCCDVWVKFSSTYPQCVYKVELANADDSFMDFTFPERKTYQASEPSNGVAQLVSGGRIAVV